MTVDQDDDPNWMLNRIVQYGREHEQESRALWEMTPAQRQAAMWRGQLSSHQLFEWAARKPSEVPLINDEFAFLAWSTPEVAELHERDR